MSENSEATAVYVWGKDSSGQLGLGKKQDKAYCYPVLCRFVVQIAEVACGDVHSIIRTLDGQLYAMGSNADGRLGINDRSLEVSRTPVLLATLGDTRIAAIACGGAHSAAVSSTAQLFTWGNGSAGALCCGTSISHWKPHLVPAPPDCGIVAVSCGGRHTAVLAQDSSGAQRPFTCGAGDNGQLGLGTRDSQVFLRRVESTESVAEVASGVSHTLFRTVSNRVFAMGANTDGQLGIGSRRSALSPAPITDLDGQGVKQISCGSFSAAVTATGALFVWGSGSFGEFLTPQKIKGELAAVTVGDGFAAATDRRGAMCTWGVNSGGQLGLGDFDDRSVPTPLPALKGKFIRQVVCGSNHAIAICDDAPNLKTQKLSPIVLPRTTESISPRQDYQSSTKVMDLYQTELEARQRLEVELLREREGKAALVKRIDALVLEVKDLKEELRHVKDDVSDREVDISRYSQKNIQLAEKNKEIADKLRSIPVFEQKVEDLLLALTTSEKAKRHLEAALESSNNKCEDLTYVLARVTRELNDAKDTSKQFEENLHAAQRTLAASRKELASTTEEAEGTIANLTKRQTELEAQLTRQMDERSLKLEEQEDTIKELRQKLKRAGEMVQQLTDQVDRLEARVATVNQDLAVRETQLAELQAEASRQEAKNKSIVEALERELKERADLLHRARATFMSPDASTRFFSK